MRARRLPSWVAVAGVGGVSRKREARPNRTPPWVGAVAQRRTRLSVSPLVSPHSPAPTLRGGVEERSAHQGRDARACGRLRSRAARAWRPAPRRACGAAIPHSPRRSTAWLSAYLL